MLLWKSVTYCQCNKTREVIRKNMPKLMDLLWPAKGLRDTEDVCDRLGYDFIISWVTIQNYVINQITVALSHIAQEL